MCRKTPTAHRPNTHWGPCPVSTNKSMELLLKTFHPVLCLQEPPTSNPNQPLSTNVRPFLHHPSFTLDKAKVEVKMPDVTNQADKEPVLQWTEAQLQPQLCTVVGAVCLLRKKERKEKKKIDQLKKEKRGGRNKAVSYNNRLGSKTRHFLPSCHVFFGLHLLTSSLVARAGPAEHISKRSCSDSSVSPNLAITNSSATVPSCGFAGYNTNQT